MKFDELPKTIRDEMFKRHSHHPETEEIIYSEKHVIELLELFSASTKELTEKGRITFSVQSIESQPMELKPNPTNRH